MKFRLFALSCLLVASMAMKAQSPYQWKTGTSGGYTYKYVSNDPTKTRFYLLKNGLTAILSQNNKAPKIVFRMAVRAGSNTDPRTNTGLAHYLEHLLFKGTDKFGTLNYAKEKPLLQKIEALYETYNKTTNPIKRKEIYSEIDKVSGEASNYAIANEYVKMMKAIGSSESNAHTALEETVYKEEIPSNVVDKFLAIQAERFRSPVFRLFHTELEAVYEEKNRILDDDDWKIYEKKLFSLFPTHNYGQQSMIGTIEHLKNPSLVEIKKYYNKYYVPNNMAIIMSGDFNYDELIKKIDKSFAYMVPKPLSLYNPAPEKSLTKIKKVDVYGPTAESISIDYRGFAQNTRQSLLLGLIGSILSNGSAGLFDNLNKEQKLMGANAQYKQMKDYGIFTLSASPKTGQSLEDVQKLLLAQIALVKKGQFDENLIKATVANIKLNNLRAFDNNTARADAVLKAFVRNRGAEWNKELGSIDEMAKVTKKEIIDFSNVFFVDNYVYMVKHKGEDKSISKVDKPTITPIKTNSNEISLFAKSIVEGKVKPIAPKFLDYTKDLSFGKAGIADVIYVKNTDNSIFHMNYKFNKGLYSNKSLLFAIRYLTHLSTDKYTAEQISKAFYNLGCSYNINMGEEEMEISISGLQENFDEAVKLAEHIFTNCKPNEKVLEDLKNIVLKEREDGKLNKDLIMNGLMNYAQYGADNPFKYTLTNDEVKNLKSEDLIKILHNLSKYKHTITYYGPKDLNTFSAEIVKVHALPIEFTPEQPIKKFTYDPTSTNKVYFVDYDMVQAEIQWVRNAGLYNHEHTVKADLFNNYFGGGMGSIVFQNIRESKALAYSTYAYYGVTDNKEKENSIVAYVGTQVDKMAEAVAAMNELLTTIPESEKSFEIAKSSLLNIIETSRITGNAIIYAYLEAKKLGFDKDVRIATYAALKPLTLTDIKAFHQANLSGKPYHYCVIASEKKVNLTELQKNGPVIKLSIADIFKY